MIDKQLVLSDGQDLTASAESTYYVDLSVARDIGKGQQLYVVVGVKTVMDSAAEAATLTIALQNDDDTSFTDTKSLLTTQAYAESVLTAGRQPIVIPIPPDCDQRYLRLYYTVGGENFTSGEIDAFITDGLQTNY